MKSHVGENVMKGLRIAFAAMSLVALMFPALEAYGQPGIKSFHFPSKVTAADYDHRFVLAKLKPEHKDKFRGTSGRTTSTLSAAGISAVRELMPSKAVLAAKTKNGPRRSFSNVDTGLYFRIFCTPGTSIEDFINGLYGTGYFEVVEPEYVNRMFYTPSDPQLMNQYYISNIKAIEAWDVTKGDPSLTIAIVDSGGDLFHEDLIGNLYTNTLDPSDGIDNDGNGYVDDSQGWDFIGGDLANLNDPAFVGDNNPQLTVGGLLGHGVNVAGCASATTDNAIGIAGVGFKTKLMFTKHSADNQPTTNGSIYLGYDGMYYAALAGADVINLSWGGINRSQIIQDIINFITTDLGVVVVAAAGNDGTDTPFYPAAYDNVISVAAVNQQNVKATFSNYGSYVDISAPGVAIFTTAFDSKYTSTQGTSFSSPIVAGAAALVKAHFPTYTSQQVAEQLRVTANRTELDANNPVFVGKLGFGVLDVKSALTNISPSVRASNPKLLNASGSPAQMGEKGYLTMTFKNILAATSSALEISISENSAFVSVVKGSIRPGAIAAGGTINNQLSPFELQIASFVPDNFEIPVTITYKDGAYEDREEVIFLLNPTFIDVDENLVTTTVSNTGRIGYEDTESDIRTKGSGFVFDNNSTLYEMGIIMGTGTGTQLYNNVRATSNTFDQDFVSIGQRIGEITPGLRSSSEISGTLSNSTTGSAQAFQLKYRSLAWKEAPYDKFVIMEYIISNPTPNAINGFYFGLFADWDITENGAQDAAKWDAPNRLGYVYPFSGSGLPHTGIQLLTGSPQYYAIDNNQSVVGNPFGLYDGFTDSEKFSALSSSRPEAGVANGGGDVSHVVSAGPFTIPAGQEIKVAFALHAAQNFAELQQSAAYADTVYNYTVNAPKPTVAAANACYGGGTSLTATGATSFNWYKNFTGGQPFFSGPVFTTGNLFNDTTFYVSNADNTYESVRTPAKVIIKANPRVSTSGSTSICSNESVTLSAVEADSYLWSNGATTQAIQVSAPGNYSVTVNSLAPACQSTSIPVTITNITAPVASFTMSGALKTFSPIQFTDQSTGAVSWNWDFGNSLTSTNQNPSTTYQTQDAYEITLRIAAANGCKDTVKQTLDVITGLEDVNDHTLEVYPNPVKSTVQISFEDGLQGSRSAELLTVQGRVLYRTETVMASRLEIPMADQPDGVYLVRIAMANRIITRKVVKIH
ncbi:MAG: S8 family serine peptidase [Cyclobacteriaceae bacterium]|nr:S8 family serine peptidase [Cyclobacteriaceae bacterium]